MTIGKNIVTVIGGGSSAHTLIPLLSMAGNEVNILTSKPNLWHKQISSKYILPDGTKKDEIKGDLTIISHKAEDVIPQSNVIILCMPVSQYRKALHDIGSYISKKGKIFVGTIYGQGGVNWMVDEIKNKFNISNVTTFACGLIPWICRIKEYGKEGITYGAKKVNYIAVSPKEDFNELNNLILNDICYSWFKQGEFIQSDNFISLTLCVDNQIIHPTRLYGLYLKSKGIWNSKKEVPFFYRDYDQLSADILADLDSDYDLIRRKIKYSFATVFKEKCL